MSNKPLPRIALSGFVALLILCLVGVGSSQVSYNFHWIKNVNFGLTAHNSTISWINNIYLNTFTISATRDAITFNDIKLVSTNVDSITLSTTVDIFVNQLDNNWFRCNMSSSGTQEITYKSTKPELVLLDGISIDENNGWGFSNGIINITGASSTLELYYGDVESGVEYAFLFAILAAMIVVVVIVVYRKHNDEDEYDEGFFEEDYEEY